MLMKCGPTLKQALIHQSTHTYLTQRGRLSIASTLKKLIRKRDRLYKNRKRHEITETSKNIKMQREMFHETRGVQHTGTIYNVDSIVSPKENDNQYSGY